MSPSARVRVHPGLGIFDGPNDDGMITALASWHVNVVHMGLNED